MDFSPDDRHQLITVSMNVIRMIGNIRTIFDDERIHGLAQSIEHNGLQHPPLCAGTVDAPDLIDGEMRLRAMRLLGFEQVPIILISDPVDAADCVARQLVCNLQNCELTPMDRSRAIRSLIDKGGITASAAAERLGWSPASISRSLRLLDLPDQLQSHVESGAMSPDVGYKLASVDDPEEQAKLADEVIGNRLTRDGLARKLKRMTSSEGASRGTRVTVPVGNGRSITVVGSNMTLESVVSLIEQLLARAKKAKTQGLSLQTFLGTMRDQVKN